MQYKGLQVLRKMEMHPRLDFLSNFRPSHLMLKRQSLSVLDFPELLSYNPACNIANPIFTQTTGRTLHHDY
jgi:hypothetical protein